MLLQAENLLYPQRVEIMVASSRQKKTSVTVREIDRRVLLVLVAVEIMLVTCV